MAFGYTIRPMSIGARIKSRREELGMSRAALAFAINTQRGRVSVDAKCIHRWENGTEPQLSTILEIAEALGVDPVWLAFGGDAAEAA